MTSLTSLKQDLQGQADPVRARHSQRFFKTGKGEYGEGDKFLGLTNPQIRTLAKKYRDLDLADLEKLLGSKIHEHRLISLFILVDQFHRANEQARRQIYDFYLKNATRVNNWDLVDSSAHKIVGWYLEDKDRAILYKLAKSKNLWEKRISIIATFWFIKNGELNDSLKIAEILLKDEHDLIHKAVGWMLRETGKKDVAILRQFLDKHVLDMPRTMLRYAIEKLPKKERKNYLSKF